MDNIIRSRIPRDSDPVPLNDIIATVRHHYCDITHYLHIHVVHAAGIIIHFKRNAYVVVFTVVKLNL